ncbi:carbohydrate ABC transporter permease [Luxibacter massiliensis]|uniref:carbohydrate ABC transporter permease n=1 Tax=Luxibacter massiliensis TaxID=2219695 RepID=UPI000F06546E|nr:carbohydrate ABC transporter permease [Luxibacter massiliensis]
MKMLGKIGKAIGIVILLAIVVVPFLWMVISSFTPAESLFVKNPSFIPKGFWTGWYENVFVSSNVPQYFINSLIVSSAVMVITVVVSALGAYSLTRFKFRGRNLLSHVILCTYIFPPILLMLPLNTILTNLDLVDTFLGIILAHLTITIPLGIWMMRSFFAAIPRELEEAGMIDGLSKIGVFRKIAIPMSGVAIFSIGLFSFIQSWNEYLYSSVFLISTNRKTLPIGIREFIAHYDIRWGEIMATSVLISIPVIVIFVSIQKYFIAGLTAGAVKE